MIKYSIILTTLNEEKRILGVMDQFEKFKRKDFEVILMDGNSSDSTVSLVKSRDYKFPLIIKVENSDVNTARNNALNIARGEIVSIATAHNLLPADYFDRLDAYYDEGYDVVLCLYALPANTDAWSGAWSYAQHRLFYDGKENTDEYLWTEGFSCRKEFAKRIKFSYINKNSSGIEGWFGKKLKDANAKIVYSTTIEVKHIVTTDLKEFFQERKNRTRGTVFMEFYVYKLPKTDIVMRAFVRSFLNFFMFLIQVPSIFEAFKLLQKAKEKNFKSFVWFYFAGQIDLLARVIGKIEAINVIKNAKIA